MWIPMPDSWTGLTVSTVWRLTRKHSDNYKRIPVTAGLFGVSFVTRGSQSDQRSLAQILGAGGSQ